LLEAGIVGQAPRVDCQVSVICQLGESHFLKPASSQVDGLGAYNYNGGSVASECGQGVKQRLPGPRCVVSVASETHSLTSTAKADPLLPSYGRGQTLGPQRPDSALRT